MNYQITIRSCNSTCAIRILALSLYEYIRVSSTHHFASPNNCFKQTKRTQNQYCNKTLFMCLLYLCIVIVFTYKLRASCLSCNLFLLKLQDCLHICGSNPFIINFHFYTHLFLKYVNYSNTSLIQFVFR